MNTNSALGNKGSKSLPLFSPSCGWCSGHEPYAKTCLFSIHVRAWSSQTVTAAGNNNADGEPAPSQCTWDCVRTCYPFKQSFAYLAQGSALQADVVGSYAVAIHAQRCEHSQPAACPIQENDSWNRNSYLSNTRMVAEAQSVFCCGAG